MARKGGGTAGTGRRKNKGRDLSAPKRRKAVKKKVDYLSGGGRAGGGSDVASKTIGIAVRGVAGGAAKAYKRKKKK